MLDTRAVALTLLFAGCGGQPETHDGFFLRITVGPGYLSADTAPTDEGIEVEENIAGDALGTSISPGWSLSPELAVHGTIMTTIADTPDLEVDGARVGVVEGRLTLAGLGAGATWFAPYGLYLSGSMLIGKLALETEGPEGETRERASDFGPLGELVAGKEWWVGANWGLGLMVMMHAGGAMTERRDLDIEWSWSIVEGLIGLSGTWN